MTKPEIIKFNAEIDKVLHLMIHSLYTNKDIFLRELISNASDACDKLRYESNKTPNLLSDKPFKISITADKKNKSLSIEDNGIGMNREELIQNLGTIASSGTQKFLETITGNKEKDLQLIGQFGVGFYSAFMIADQVVVETKKAGEKETWLWTSKGNGEFSISKRDQEREVGTKITLHIKDSELEFLDSFKINHIIRTYSDHVSIPIEFVDLEKEKEAEVINSSAALWLKPRSEISEDEYNQFYKKTSFAGDTPWMILHNKNEGALEYINLLFIPSNKTFDLFHPDRKRSVKLYIKRVFINDDGIDIIPQYLRFLRGIVDSEDLPLNINRETLQHNNILNQIKQSITSRVLNELEKKLKNDFDSYIDFWKNFGAVLKEGLCERLQSAEKLMNICLFKSMMHGKFITLDEYIKNMPDGQKDIYYITGDEGQIENSPQLEGFKNKEIDVLLLTDPVDDFWVNNISTHHDKQLKSVTRSDIDIQHIGTSSKNESDTDNSQNKDTPEQDRMLLDYFKNILGDVVKNVKISKKLTNTPVCLVSDEGSMDIRMERFLIEQKQLNKASAKVLEINNEHPIICSISEKIKNNSTTSHTDEVIRLLFDQACIIENEPVANASDFSKRLNTLITGAL
ncbi:MAG: molecular chaperone HtpG [Rickettsiales bacterium]|nr:molecular chaperone HtpG [Rickettsiales bacterium]